MTDNQDDEYKLSLEDRLVWHAYVEQEQIEHHQAFEEVDFEGMLAEESNVPIQKTKAVRPDGHKPSSPIQKKSFQSNGLDRRTDEKLRKGKMPIEARCDLHGLNQTQAHEMLNQFIHMAILRQCRCVLVITGKGKSRLATEAMIEPERGVLKQKVPQWLSQKGIAEYVLKTYPAQPKDGGSGALYVYLRRQR